jgi:uncharacterized protein YndB with AHSA1/START domain
MPDSPFAEAKVTVPVPPGEAFRIFTADIGTWWKPGSIYWNDSDRGLRVEIEPFLGGRFREIYDEAGSSYEIGTVTAWEPGVRLSVTWRQGSWESDATTDVDITFEPSAPGTLVTLRHSGFDRVGSTAEGYDEGWAELLGWFAGAAA